MITTVLLLLFTVLCILLSADRAWDNVTKPERNDLVFDGRHRSYGAFVLRREYDRRALLAFVGALGLVGGAIPLPALLRSTPSIHVAPPTRTIDIDLTDTYTVPPPAPQPAPKPLLRAAPAPAPAPHDVVVIPTDSVKTAPDPDPKMPDPGPTGPAPSVGSGPKGPDPGPSGGSTGSPLGSRDNPTGLADVDVAPEFVGGMDAMVRFVQDHIRFPEDEAIAQKEYVEFIVDADGSVIEVRAKGRAAVAYGKAAEAVVRAMPKWKPARKRGELVACRLVLPIDFRTK
mgnify:CR=1 FL=1